MKQCEICHKTEHETEVKKCTKAGMYLCGKHRQQFMRYGKILNRTKFDKNDYILYDDYAEIIIYGKNHMTIIGKVKIDIEDLDRCLEYKWSLTKNKHGCTYYAATNINKKKYCYIALC